MNRAKRKSLHANIPATVKVVVEHHADGFVAYPIGMRGVVVAEGGTLDEVMRDVRSAIRFHVQTFGPSVASDLPLETMLAEVLMPGRRTG